MIKVFIPSMKDFPYEECKKMYEEQQKAIGDNQSFDNVILNTMFFAFTKDDKLLGGIYFYDRCSRTFVNVFAGRKTYLDNQVCFKWSLLGFNRPVYATTEHRYIRLQLLKLGFEKIGDNLCKYERN